MMAHTPIRIMRIIARLNVGGPAIHVTLLTAGLHNERVHSTLVTGTIGKHEGDMGYLAHEMGVEPVTIPTMGRAISPVGDLRTFLTLCRLMREHRPHVVHTHTAKAGFLGRLAAWVTRVPVTVHTFHGHVFHGYFGSLKTSLFIRLERLAARGSDAILTISDGLRDELIGYGIAPPTKVRVVPLGLNLTPLAGNIHLSGQLRNEIGCSTDEKLVGIIGRLVPIKNHALFLRAAHRACQRMPNIRFVIVGGGELREELEELTEELGLSDRVVFLGWRKDLARIFADLDLVAITSRNEGTPVSLIEAMAAGVPVVSTRVGGVADLLGNGEYGRLVPSDDVVALAAAITEELRDPQSERVKRAKAYALNTYSAENLVANMRSLYTELLRQKAVHIPYE